MVRWTDDDPGAGEVAELENLARRVDAFAEQLWYVRKNVWAASDPVTEEAWAGQAGDEWREQVEQALPTLQTVVDVAAVAAALVQILQSAPPPPRPLGVSANRPATGPLVKELADKRRIANASLEDAQDDKRAAERAMDELADRRRNADRRVIEALGPVEVSEWEHIGQAVITAGFTSPRQLGEDPMGAAMMRLSVGVYSGTADRATADMATVMAYRLMDEWMNSFEAQLLMRIGREHPDLLNELLRTGIAAKGHGDWVGGVQGVGTGIRNHRHSAEVAAAIGIIYTKFRPHGPWDAKPHLAAQFGAVDEPPRWLPTSTGKEIYYDVFGNIQYGAMMSRFGVEPKLALAASHMDGTGQAGEGAEDDPFILLGYDLAAKYPKGPTEAQFEAWFSGFDVQKTLKAMGRIR